MEQQLKSTLLTAIGTLYDKSDGCELKPGFFEEVDGELQCLSAYFELTKMQSFLSAMLIFLGHGNEYIDFRDMIHHFHCNPMKLLEFGDDFDVLHARGIVRRRKSPRRSKLLISNFCFSINEKIPAAIVNAQPMPLCEKEVITDVFEVLEENRKLVELRRSKEFSTGELAFEVDELLSANLKFPLISEVKKYNLGDIDCCVLLYVIWDSIMGDESTNFANLADQVFDSASERYRYIHIMTSGQHKLIARKHIELVPSAFRNTTDLKLSERSVQMLKDCDIKLFFNEKSKKPNVIEPEKIVSKKLYFNDFEQNQLGLLKKLMTEEMFNETQARLQSKGMPKGITALLHGPPGTGKTETVLQVAKATNREILKVDISDTKSMWFGESERMIKKIFTDYNEFAAGCKRAPILLFNEADAIISKRASHGSSGTSQTQNTIQNILLEELENFSGIFFATTNLVGNLDSAFERRFLFKIELQKPEAPVKSKIWHSRLPGLSEEECASLANHFDLSGGQIENIIRKNHIYEIIHGKQIDFQTIVDFCSTEHLSKNNGARIGFTKA